MVAYFSLNFGIMDGDGKTSIMTVNVLNPDDDVTNWIQYAQDVAELIDAVITGAIVSIGVCLNVALPGGIGTAADVLSDVEEGARFIFNSTGGFHTSTRVPTFDETKIVAGTDIVDQADADVIALENALIAGIVYGVINYHAVDSRGVDVIGLKSARESFLSSRRSR